MPLLVAVMCLEVDVYLWKVWSSDLHFRKREKPMEIFFLRAFRLLYVILLEGRLDGNQWDSLLLSFWAGEGCPMVCRWV